VWSVYPLILAVTDVLGSQKFFKVAKTTCFDEMFFALADGQTMPAQAFNTPGSAASRL
jgi:hypothetical protein